MRKGLTAGVLTAALTLGMALPAGASIGNNHAFAHTGDRRTTDVNVKWQVAETGRNNVVANNMARAESEDCTNCRTVAVAVAIDLMTTDKPVISITANSTAEATNTNCVSCDTTALAYQFIVAPGVPETFTQPAQDTLNGIMAQVQAKALSGEPGTQLAVDVDALMGQVSSVVTNPASYTAIPAPIHVRLVESRLRDVGFTHTLIQQGT